MDETMEDMDKEIERKGNKSNFLADKIGSSDEQFIREMKQVNPNELLDKTDRVRKRVDKRLEKHKQSFY